MLSDGEAHEQAHDFVTTARRVVEQAIGERLEGEPLESPKEGKNPIAVERESARRT